MNIKVQDKTYFFLDDDNGDGGICRKFQLDEGSKKIRKTDII